jgi:pimeloyl-ACP methyl ester carboxylesterase
MAGAWDEFTPEERHEVTEVFAANIMTVTRSSWMGIYRAITHRIDFMDALEGTAVPVLYLYGEASKYRAMAEVNARRFQEQNLNVEVVTFRNGVHDLQLQYPDDVSKIALDFFGPRARPQITVGATAGPGAGEALGPTRGRQ